MTCFCYLSTPHNHLLELTSPLQTALVTVTVDLNLVKPNLLLAHIAADFDMMVTFLDETTCSLYLGIFLSYFFLFHELFILIFFSWFLLTIQVL